MGCAHTLPKTWVLKSLPSPAERIREQTKAWDFTKVQQNAHLEELKENSSTEPGILPILLYTHTALTVFPTSTLTLPGYHSYRVLTFHYLGNTKA